MGLFIYTGTKHYMNNIFFLACAIVEVCISVSNEKAARAGKQRIKQTSVYTRSGIYSICWNASAKSNHSVA